VVAATHVRPGSRFVEFTRAETEQSIAERFEKQVRKNPCRIAVRTSGIELTYDDLNKLANRLARVLLEQFPDHNPVAILMEHDAPVIAAIFSALKSAKVFIPLDPALPDARIGHILDDSGANVIMTNDQRLETVLAWTGASRRVLNVDHFDTSLSTDNLDLKISPDSTSYILYTSGSTGRPKGVIRTHRNDLHNIRHHTNSLRFCDGDRMTLLGSFSTGQGIQDIFDALLNGATLFPWNLKTEGLNGLAEWLSKEKITVYHSAATLFRHFVRNLGGGESLPDLRVVRLGSEPMSWKDVDAFKEHFSDDCTLSIELSCSEANTIAQFLVNKQTEINITVPVGFPVEDKEILILDELGDKLGPGEIGEIAVRSRFLTPGYWKRSDLTELAFIPDRESLTGRIYRTGDLGRRSPDGCLEHFGRKDTQVKIRGYRVETFEVELSLLQIPGVDQVFVTHRQDTQGESYLVAYIVPDNGATLAVSELRADLNSRLPGYMVPRVFLFLETLPLTPTGKVDRRGLPEVRAERPPLAVPLVSPREPIEESVAKHWSQLLGFGIIGVDDNLFDLGGNSLSAMQILAWVKRTFHVNMSLERFYESPTIASLSSSIASGLETAVASEDSRISNQTQYYRPPLSFSQERLWFMEQWEPGKSTYNLSLAYCLTGAIHVWAMEESLNAVIERHEVLRTSFGNDDDPPSQIIAPVLRLVLAIADLRALPAAERNEASLRLAQEDARRPFDLAQAPLLRVLLVRLDDQEHLLVFTVHQIVCDGWSMRILLAEFWQLYGAISHNRSPSLPNLSVQYADFAVWQHRLMSEEWINSHLSYWKETLSGAPPELNFPTDKPRPALQSFRGSRIPIELSESLTAALNQLSRQEGVTLFVTLMAAFNTLLYRYTGQEDLVVGFPVADRNWGEATGSIGFFVNTLVARTDLSGKPTFRELLFRVRDVCLGAYAHQDLPFEKLVQELHLNRDLSRNPLFQVMFSFQNMPLAYPEVAELGSTPINIDNGTSKFDLTLSLAERDHQLIGFFEYCTDLFERTTMERLAVHFRRLLECVVAERNQSVAKLAFLTELERRQLLTQWNDTKADYCNGSRIHELFESQVDKTPDAIALEYKDESLTFRELNIRANQIAHHLRGLGVGAESLVGICLARSMDMVVGLLGTLKAGAAYVPLDPAYPKERLRFMMRDARVSVLLTTEKLIEDGEWRPEDGKPRSSLRNPRLKWIYLDRDLPIIERQKGDNPTTQLGSDSPAYVIYTSGSTGDPKGVVGLHRGALNRFSWMWKTYPFEPNEKCCVKTSLSFVDSVWEIFGPLLQGIPLVLIPDEILKDPQSLVGSLRNHHVTRIGLVPSFLKTLLDVFSDLRAHLPELKLWSCSGEFLPRDVVAGFRKSMPDGTLLNLYGSSEVSADVTYCDTRIANLNREIPIGRPINNTQVYIVDSNLQLAPIGVSGELCVAGDGLARGYLNRPELTEEKFIPNPFNTDPTSRLYRTGDLARYLADGTIEFLGRSDNQVKIRGYRIELGEVESALSHHPAVKESAVVACAREKSSDKELVGFLVPGDRAALSVTELRSFLREKLPDYMIPSSFVFLDALPLTPNGKIDRGALRPPSKERPRVDHKFTEPRAEIEELVAQVWREVLRLDKIGVYDNFFDLGGHSLLAMRIVARLRNHFQVDLALRKLFELPTVAGLAQHIELLRRSRGGAIVAPIVPVPRDQPLPLSFSQRRLWYLQKVDANLSAYNIPASFRIKGDLDVDALEQALNQLIARHEVLRSAITEHGGQPQQEIMPTLQTALPVADLSNLPYPQAEADAKRLSNEDARLLHVLENPPLLRVMLAKLADGDHVFILNFHHIIADGSSMAIFYRELAALYAAARDAKPALLTELPIQYADYAAWQHEWLKSGAFDAQLGYWKRQLADLPAPVELPTDFERPTISAYRGARLAKQLSPELTASLKTLSRQHGATLFMTLFATFNILLSRISGQDDIVIGSTIAGRNQHETDGLIGFFINALPLRTNLSGDPSFTTLLHRVRENCLDAYTHQETPFEKIVEELRPRRDRGRNPIFEILFNIADTRERSLALPGCEVAKFSHAEPGAKFDIVLHAPENDGKIELAIVYNADLFRATRIAVLLDQFASLIQQVIDHPDQSIRHLSLVTEAHGSYLPDPTEALDSAWIGAIHECLAVRARLTPDKFVVVDPDQSWTYGEIDQAANRLANALIASGIRPKDTVAIYAHRRSSLVIAIFGILEAGASFLILDPAHPPRRTIEYLRIARPKAWVSLAGSDPPPQELLSYLDGLELRCRVTIPQAKTDITKLLSQFSDREVNVAVAAADPAYVAFTSGSTGEPKGVVCRHGPITHFLPWQKETFELNENDRFAMLSGLAYSHLHRDVFTAIHLGATIYIPNESEARSPDQLARWLEQNAITVLHLTPALGQLLLAGTATNLPSVRRIFFGGDVLTLDEVAHVRRLTPNATIGSFYGTTETQRAVGYYEITDEGSVTPGNASRPVPLGRGIENVQLLVLNNSGQMAGVGELGQLYVRSPHLAEGYVADEARTQQMFLTNPFTNDPLDRLYRTGELGRYLADGNVEWAGRNDRRVNIRGFRVELEEIEAVLKQHPAVKDAAVVLQEVELPTAKFVASEDTDNPKSKIQTLKSAPRLVAYVVADEAQPSLVDSLPSILCARLPDYMVPSHFVVLDGLPLNPNGKIDYRSLPTTVQPLAGPVESFVAPRSDLEARLCSIFAQVLAIEQVGVNDNFFHLGGHSLLAAQAAARMKQALGVEIELRAFLESPTVAELARTVASHLPAGQTMSQSAQDEREEFVI
jgi:amino acid adenylation domain-containing protein